MEAATPTTFETASTQVLGDEIAAAKTPTRFKIVMKMTSA